MIWYVLRHAEKEPGDFYNPRLKLQDDPLSPTGLQSARRLVQRLGDKPISAIYVSAYLRTLQTAAPLAEHLHLTLIVDVRLNEIDTGALGNLTEEEFKQAYPEIWQIYHSRSADFRFPGGETGAEVQDRLKSFFEEKLHQHKDEDILLVAHDGLIRLMLCYLLRLPVYRRADFHLDFCGLTELQYQEEYKSWQILCFNQTSI